MKRKKGDSAPHPSIFHPKIYVPHSKQAEVPTRGYSAKIARPQSRPLKPPVTGQPPIEPDAADE